MAERINNPSPTPIVIGSTYVYCNTTPIVVPYTGTFSSPATAAPYPSNIIVSNLPGTLNALTVRLNLDANFNDTQDVAALLIGPTGANIDFFSNVGGFGVSSGAVTYDVYDGAGAPFGQFSSSDFPPSGTTNVSDTLPSGYSLSSYSGSGWGCGSVVNVVTCTSTQAISSGSSFPTLKLIVNVPASSPASVSNTALAWGGGDVTHTSAGTAAQSNSDTVSVTQVVASVAATSGSGQSTTLSTAFGNPLVVTVKDAAGVVISGASVTFTAPASGASGTFSNSTATITSNTNASGQLSESFAANGTAGGPYTVTATSNSIATSPGFSLTNTVTAVSPPTIGISFSAGAAALGETVGLSFAIQNPNAGSTLTGLAFTDSLPAGLAVSNTPGVTNTCGGTVTSVAGSSSISLSGGTLASGGSCALSLNLQATSLGTKNNTTGLISANESGPGSPSNTASLDVVQPPSVTAVFGAPSILLNGSTTLTYTITNPTSTTEFLNIGLTDTLPGGLVVSSPNGVSGTCISSDSAAVAANPGSASISISALNLAASSSCGISLSVTGTIAGSKNNSTGNITATFDNGMGMFPSINGATASAGIAVIAPPAISAVFSPAAITAGDSSSLRFTITNPAANTVSLSGLSFTDALPAGLTVTNATSSACGGTVTTSPGTGIVLSNGSLGVNSNCQFSVSVTGSATGSYTDTTGAITSSDAGSGNMASANLIVESPMSAPANNNLAISPTALSFTYSIGQATTAQSQSISVTASTAFTLGASVAGGAWLSAATSGDVVTVKVNAAGLAAGTYQGSVLLAISLVSGPVSVPVNLTVIGPPVLIVSGPSLSFTAIVSPGTTPPAQTKSILIAAQNSNVAFTVSSSAPWLGVTSSPSNTPSLASVTVTPGTMAPGTYNGSIGIAAAGATNSPLAVPVTLTIVSPLVIASGGFENAASFHSVPGAPNAIMAMYGDFSCASTPSVLVNNSAAEVIGATASQITFTLPASVDGENSAAIAVSCNGQQAQSAQLPLAAVSPGIFTLSMTGTGQGAVVNQDGTVNGPSYQAALNTYLSVYGTGFGTYLAPGANGLQELSHTVQAFIGGVPAQIQFAGHAPDSTLGLQQINVLIPSNAPTGLSVPIQLVVDGVSTQSGVTVAIH